VDPAAQLASEKSGVVGLAWVLIELAIPGVAFVTYFLVRGMLARVVNERHRCEGDWGRSLRWAAYWATLYMLPLVGLVLLMLLMQKAFVAS